MRNLGPSFLSRFMDEMVIPAKSPRVNAVFQANLVNDVVLSGKDFIHSSRRSFSSNETQMGGTIIFQ